MSTPFLVSIDPGVKIAAAAGFYNGNLRVAELHTADNAAAMRSLFEREFTNRPPEGWIIVVEKMHVYSKNQFAAKNMIELSILGGWLRPDYMYTYQEWAGSLKEGILWNRILGALTEEEKKVLPKNLGPHKDVLAAVGIGLYHLGRMPGRKPR